jgi:hypothetical protein
VDLRDQETWRIVSGGIEQADTAASHTSLWVPFIEVSDASNHFGPADGSGVNVLFTDVVSDQVQGESELPIDETRHNDPLFYLVLYNKQLLN